MERGINASTKQCLNMAAAVAILVAAATVLPVLAETNATDDGDATTYSFHVKATPPPQPAFKVHLLRPERKLMQGNAALLYYQMIASWPTESDRDEKVNDLLGALDSPEKIAQARDLVKDWTGSTEYQLLRLAVRRNRCDWGLPLAELGWRTPLPTLGRMRQATRNLSLQAELAVLDGDADHAVEAIQDALAMSFHTAASDLLISHLVAIACQSLLADRVADLMGSPACPNLYWALMELPDPKLDCRKAIEKEAYSLCGEKPYWDDPLNADLSPQQWRQEYMDWAKLIMANDANEVIVQPAETLRVYTLAREYYLQRGMTVEQVNAYPMWQLVIAHNIDVYKQLMDEVKKSFYIDYRQKEALEDIDARISRESRAQKIPATILIPALGKAQTIYIRNDAKYAALACIEAARAYAAAHEGQLPASLEDIPDTPAPVNPFTGEAFDWTLRPDGSALLEYAVGNDRKVRMELTLERENPTPKQNELTNTSP